MEPAETDEIRNRRIEVIDALIQAGVTKQADIYQILDKVLYYCQAISESAIKKALDEYESKLLRSVQTGNKIM